MGFGFGAQKVLSISPCGQKHCRSLTFNKAQPPSPGTLALLPLPKKALRSALWPGGCVVIMVQPRSREGPRVGHA